MTRATRPGGVLRFEVGPSYASSRPADGLQGMAAKSADFVHLDGNRAFAAPHPTDFVHLDGIGDARPLDPRSSGTA